MRWKTLKCVPPAWGKVREALGNDKPQFRVLEADVLGVSLMHPWMAVWIWSMVMSQVWQNSMSAGIDGASNDNSVSLADAAPIIVPARDYLKTEIVDQMLPALILDRLADLHWLEEEPALAV